MSQYPPHQPNYSTTIPQPSAGLAIASLVTGIVSLIFCFPYVAIPCGILAIVFGVIAIKKAHAGTGSGGGMAKAGLILGSIGLLIDVLVVVLIITFGVSIMKGLQQFQQQQQQQMRQQQQQQQSQPQNPAPPTDSTTPSAPEPTPASPPATSPTN